MLQEEISVEMERKTSNRNSSVPPKSNGCQESKKSESGNGSRFNRHNKKREPAGVRQRQDNGGTVRKPAPQKSRASTDKRPRSRGLFGDRQREEVNLAEERVEYGSALQKGSRKGNLNHLLNFTFTPRDTFDGAGARGPGSYGRVLRRGRYKAKYNKEQFLQANCQFIVREDADYTVHSTDPDRLVDWDLIEQIRVCSFELPSCPICLYPPVAAKITRCGHIYCSACVLHYLALGEKDWRKCPICYEAIHKRHLKSVQTTCAPKFKVGDEITFQLMKKERGSTLALPKSFWTPRDGKPLSINDELVSLSTSLVVATEEEVRQLIIEPERQALQAQLKSEEASEICFVESALAQLNERANNLKGKKEIKQEIRKILPEVIEEKVAVENVETSPSKSAQFTKIVQYSDAFSDEEADICEVEVSPECIGLELETDDVVEGAESCGLKQEGSSELTNEETREVTEDCGEIETDMLREGKEDILQEDEAIEYLAVEESPKPETSNSANKFYYFYQGPVCKTEERLTAESSPSSAIIKRWVKEFERGRESLEDDPGSGQLTTSTRPENKELAQTTKDGQRIYIHAVNARCLVREYGSLENCPETLTATVVEIESVFMTQELRRRLRYLCHLPLTCEFQVAEVILKPPAVSNETLDFFAAEIERRHRLRQKKSRDERKRTKKIELEEKKKQGYYPALRVSLNSQSQFPATAGNPDSSNPSSNSSNSTPVASPTNAQGLNVFANEFVPGAIGTSPSSSTSWGSESGTMSFATMLKEGKAMPKVWPKSMKTAVGTSFEEPKSVTGRTESDESDPEDKIPVPEFHSAFEDGIQQAFDNLSKAKVENGVNKPAENGGRKKKKQKKLLFTTTMTRGK